MNIEGLVDAAKTASFGAVRLAVRDPQLAREYWSQSVRRYNELIGSGLRARSPIEYVQERGWAAPALNRCVQLPVTADTAGGTSLGELAVLAMATRVLQPRRIFEIGTFLGRTTSVFILNAPDAEVLSLDLPLDVERDHVTGDHYLDTDIELVARRRVGAFLHANGLADRYTQLLCDSRTFDPAPYAGVIELGFIDGAHALDYVRNDTEKMAAMMADRGLVFWHDYGGKGRFRDLTTYLERLADRFEVYRVPDTTLAWAPADQLRRLFA